MSTASPEKITPIKEKGRRTMAQRSIVGDVTPQQEAYCRARALGMTMKESAKAANIAPGNYHKFGEWERLPQVKARIAELCKIASENSILKAGLDRSWVISRLMTITDRCMQAEPVTDRNGEPTGEYRFDSNGANKALELLGKTLRMWDGKDNTSDNELANLSDEDIARIAGELAAQTGLLEVSPGIEASAGSEQVIEVQAIRAPD